MSLRNRINGLIAALALTLAFGATVQAQQPSAEAGKASKQQQEVMKKRGERHHRGTPTLRIMRQLDLTEAQEQQARLIVERFTDSIEPQRQALMELGRQREEQGTISDEARQKAQELRGQIHKAREQMQSELLALLTPEQRAKYEQLEQEWKTRRAEHRQRRGRGERMPPPEEQ